MNEKINRKANRRIIFWAIVLCAFILFLSYGYHHAGIGMGLFLGGTPIGLPILALATVSPFALLVAVGRRYGKNISALLLIPGSYFMWHAGNFLAFELVDDVSLSFLFTFVAIPVIIACAIVLNPLQEKRLSCKIVIPTYLAIFGMSFAYEWNSTWNKTVRLNSALELDSVVRCEDEERFPSLEAAMERPLAVCSFRLEGENVTYVPSEIASFKNLRELHLVDTKIKHLPSFIGELKKLEKINLLRSDFSHIPRVFCELPNLQEVDLLGTEIPIDDLKGLYVAFPDIGVHFVGITNMQPPEIIEQWREYGIPSLCDLPETELDALAICTQEPEVLANGRPVFPAQDEFAHLQFFGELFTASKCGRADRVFGVENGHYTLMPEIRLVDHPSDDLLSALMAVGFRCSMDAESESVCTHWTLKSTVPINDILILENYADEIRSVGCLNCG